MPTLEQIQAKLKKLQAQEELLIAKRNQSILNQIRKLMDTHGLTTADIEAHSSAPAKRRGRPAGSLAKTKGKQSVKAKTAIKGKLPAKYRDPKTGATWSGWARPPLWIKDVKDRSKFLIDGSAGNDITTNVSRKTASLKSVNPGVKNVKAKGAKAKRIVRKSSAVRTGNAVDQTSPNGSADSVAV